MRTIIQTIIFLPIMLLLLGMIYFGKAIKWIVFGVESEREKAGY